MRATPFMALVLPALLAAGCSTVPREAGFPDVERNVAERTGGKRVHWNQGTASDAAVAESVNALLATEMTADSAVQVALLNNRNLQATYENLMIAQADLVGAGLLRNPVFDAEIRFAEGGGGTGIEMALVQDFIDILYIPLRKRLAAAAFEATKLRVAGEVIGLASEVRAAFYTLQGSQQTLDMRRQVLAATAASYELAQRLRAAGNNRELDLANERALHEQSKLDVRAAEAQVAGDRERLNRLMGLWGTRTGWTVASRLPDLPGDVISFDGLERRAIEQSLDLGAARLEVVQAARAVGIAAPFAAIPEAELGAAAEREPDGAWAVGPAFSLPIPLFNQGQPVIASARAELRQARERYAATAVEIRSMARVAHEAVAAARDQAQYYEQVILPLRQQIVEQTQLQYNAMQIGAFQLLQAKQEQIDAGNAYIRTLRDYWIARTELDLLLSGRMASLDGGNTDMNESSTSPARAGEGGH